MSTASVKLRALLAWMVLLPLFVSMPLAHIWNQQTFARLTKEVASAGHERDRLNIDVMRLETETRGLRGLSRLEDTARRRLGMIHPGPPVLVRPGADSQAPADGGGLRFAFWKGWFR